MRRIILPVIALQALMTLYFFAWKKQTQPVDLTIYAYPSFVASWGAGPRIIENFEREYNVAVELVEAGHSGLLVQRLVLEKEHPVADVVLGFDQFILDQADELSWRSLQQLSQSVRWSKNIFKPTHDDHFVAYDWAPLTLIYRQGGIQPPQRLKDVLRPEYKGRISLMDPRSSSLGFQFIGWVMALFGAEGGSEFLEKLQPQVFAWSPSWSTAYGFFKKQQADLVFSYLTSPVYHWQEEKDETFQPIVFSHPHPYQMEYVGVLASCQRCDLAEKFVSFILRPNNQKLIAENNYMLPTVKGVPLATGFAHLPQVELLAEKDVQWIQANKQRILGTWKMINEHH